MSDNPLGDVDPDVRLGTAFARRLQVRCWKVIMAKRKQAEAGGAAKKRTSAAAPKDETEQFRRLAEEARDARDHHREALGQSDRNKSGCGTPRRRRASPVRTHG